MNAKDVAAEVDGDLSNLFRGFNGEYTSALGKSHQAAFRAGEVSAKQKELIALAISVYGKCEGCVVHHTRSAVQKGASRSELVEVLAVAVQMGGGPGTIYAAKALAAYDAFAAS